MPWNSRLWCYLRGYSHSTIKRERRALALEPRISARKCKLWHKLRKLDLPDEMCDICSEFRLVRRRMLTVRDRRTSLLEEERIERQQASSKVRLFFLSPESQKVRHENIQKERKNFRRIAERMISRTSVTVNQQQNSELVKLVQPIESCKEGQEGLAKYWKRLTITSPVLEWLCAKCGRWKRNHFSRTRPRMVS